MNEFYINTTDKVSQIFLPISNITSDLRTYRSKYENLIALEASYRNGQMKGHKYLNLKTKINGELRFAKSNVDKGYNDLNATIVNYFKKDLMNLAESNTKIALFKPYIEPNYAKQKAKVRKYKKTYPFKSGSFLLSIIFKTLKWMNFYISKGLSFWDINNRYNNINTNYLISKRNGDRQVIIESSGFLASAFTGYTAGKLGGAAGSALGFKMGFGICLVTPLMPLSPFCGFVGAVTGGFAGAIVGAGIGGAIGDWIGQGVGGFIDDISQSAKNFLMLWNMNKEKISAPIILENNK